MILQLLALAAAAGRVGWSAHFPQPVEQNAMAEMLVVQIGASALLFPILLRDWTQFVLALAGALPMIELSSLLSGEPMRHAFSAAMLMTVWLFTLRLWRIILRGEQAIALLTALAALWAIGGPILLYLRAEYDDRQGGGLWSAAAGPMAAALGRLGGGPQSPNPADFCLLAVLAAGIIILFYHCKTSRQIIHNLST